MHNGNEKSFMVQITLVFILVLFFGMAKGSEAAGPVIYPVASTNGVTVAYIVWSTDVASTSRVDYGSAVSYGSVVSDANSTTWHKMTITGLVANTTYHYRVTSGTSVSDDYTFTTYANPSGTVRTVGASGKNHATIQDCSNAASAGDTCLVYAGTYNETVTPSKSGTLGNYITFIAQETAIVKGFNLTNAHYIAIKGFEINNNSSHAILACGADNMLLEKNFIDPTGGQAVRTLDPSCEANDIVIRGNVVSMGNIDRQAIYAYGDRALVENNVVSGGSDCILFGSGGGNGHGIYTVVRNNICHHHDHDLIGGTEHIDGIQVVGGTYASYGLIEGNIVWSCHDTTGNCHCIIVRSLTLAIQNTNMIIRYNFCYDIQNGGLVLGGATDNVPYAKVYNNTIALEEAATENGNALSFQNADYGSSLNNIFYNSGSSNWSPQYGAATANYDIAYSTANPSATWGNPYASEATYATLHNKDPKFSSYPTSIGISALSPALDSGGPLTSVAAGDSGSGTSLVVNDAAFFKAGWAGTQADWIAVGTISNVAQISSINYGTNTITLANSISRVNGQSVWLYKKSDGVQVLFGTAPDIGAYEYVSGITHTVMSSVSGGNGTLSCNSPVSDGSTTTCLASPNSGYYTSSVSGCGGTWSSGNNYTTGAVTTDCTVTAKFVVNPVTVKPAAPTGLTVK